MPLVLALVNDDEIIITGPCVIKIKDHQVTKRVKLVFDAPPATRITRGKAVKKGLEVGVQGSEKERAG